MAVQVIDGVTYTINQGQTAVSASLPAPVGGLNRRDAIDQMAPTDAMEMVNFTPRTNWVELRGGQSLFATAFPAGPVETIAEFNYGGDIQMVAAGGGTIASLDLDTAIATTLGTGFTSNQWQTVMLGGYLLMVNGADTPQKYDGTSLSANTFTGSGLTATNLIGITVHRSRLFLWEAAKSWFWYGSAAAIAGALQKFDLATVCQRGGTIKVIANWTRDGGAGIDDLLVIIMSTGEVIIYTGGDPAAWSLVGRFNIPSPLAVRGVEKVGGDVVVLTRDGAVSLNTVLPLDRTRQSATLTDKISRLWLDLVGDYAANYGWEVRMYPKGGLLVFNVPVSTPAAPTPVTSYQLVQNSDTGGWSMWQSASCRTLGIVDDRLFIGSNEQGVAWDSGVWNVSPWYSGGIVELDKGTADLALDMSGNLSSASIQGDLSTSFVAFAGRTGQKEFTMVRPMLQSDGAVPANIALRVDYDESLPTYATVASAAGSAAIWDSATWNTTDWAAGLTISKDWQTVFGIGYNASLSLRVLTSAQTVRFLSCDFTFNGGAIN